jgi:hypothetical protein
MASSVVLVLGAWMLSLAWLVAAAAGMALSIGIQGRGHRLEPVPPEPFAGPVNFLGRLLFEQWVTFPRFVLSGAWRRNLTASSAPVR